jgi:hypothetical protein
VLLRFRVVTALPDFTVISWPGQLRRVLVTERGYLRYALYPLNRSSIYQFVIIDILCRLSIKIFLNLRCAVCLSSTSISNKLYSFSLMDCHCLLNEPIITAILFTIAEHLSTAQEGSTKFPKSSRQTSISAAGNIDSVNKSLSENNLRWRMFYQSSC